MTLMHISMEAVLEAAGIRSGEGPVEILRDGFPSFVARVAAAAFPGHQSVVLKACPDSSREPDVLLNLYRAKTPVPAVFDIREGDGFRIIVMEDVGGDALHKHPNQEWYVAAVGEIARIHRRYDEGWMRVAVAKGKLPVEDKAIAALDELLPMHDRTSWESTIREAAEGTIRRIEDGTYRGLAPREREGFLSSIDGLVTSTLCMVWEMDERLPRTLVHGDYHDGNVLVRSREDGAGAPGPFAIVDWDSARVDSGFFDLVSLYDVAERMGTFRLDPAQMIETYLQVRWLGHPAPSDQVMAEEWRRCRILRAWNELRWFSETGEDFGDRVPREVAIIQSHGIGARSQRSGKGI